MLLLHLLPAYPSPPWLPALPPLRLQAVLLRTGVSGQALWRQGRRLHHDHVQPGVHQDGDLVQVLLPGGHGGGTSRIRHQVIKFGSHFFFTKKKLLLSKIKTRQRNSGEIKKHVWEALVYKNKACFINIYQSDPTNFFTIFF